MDKYVNRIQQVREHLKQNNLQAAYFTGTDPHMSEYLPKSWNFRKYISGFTGSYGEVVIIESEAGLWTDTRYFIQAINELEGSGIKMHKLRVVDAVPFDDWLCFNLPKGSRVGVDPLTLSIAVFEVLAKKFDEAGLELVLIPGQIESLWENRPQFPGDNIFDLDVKYTGISRNEKFDKISSELNGADVQVISALDDLAWTFNLRANDIPYFPVFLGFALVGKNYRHLFAEIDKIPAGLLEKLQDDGVKVYPYNFFYEFLSGLKDQTIQFDPAQTNVLIQNSIGTTCKAIKNSSIPAQLKSVKNSVEIEGFKQAMVSDGLALVHFLYWINNSIGRIKITEFSVGQKLTELRAGQNGARGDSFPTIACFGDHGAVIHYQAKKNDCYELKPDNLLLVDSGGHYLFGTTDTTRTIALGQISMQQKRDFTVVLKAMIGLTQSIFPAGTRGCNIDVFARKVLWENGLNYGHGTGHGIGHYLSVHEGPVAIRQEINNVSLKPGMVLSNEPGLYREGEYGIRTENVVLCVEKQHSEFGNFLGFETLTLCPIDLSLINSSLLSDGEIQWINNYHQDVYTKLAPFLGPDIKRFLSEITQPIS